MVTHRPPRVALFGQFGVGNIGNEASLASAIEALRARPAQVQVVVAADMPEQVTDQHGVPAVPIALATSSMRLPRPARMLTRLVGEPLRWWSIYRFCRSVDLIVVPGTGILDDFGVRPRQTPYDLLRWTTCARLAQRPWAMLAVGAGPIDRPLSRRLLRQAARNASRVSYRDADSLAFMQRLGAPHPTAVVHPDVVFGLQVPEHPDGQHHRPVVALGVMAYHGWEHDPASGRHHLDRYVAGMTGIARRLLSAGHDLRLVIGEHDDAAIAYRIVTTLCTERVPDDDARVASEPVRDFADLVAQVQQADVLVATRFHNVVAGLMTGTPTVSIGYSTKNDAVMAQFGLGAYCHQVGDIDVDHVVEDVSQLLQQSSHIRPALLRTAERCAQSVRAAFDDVFDRLLDGPGPSSPARSLAHDADAVSEFSPAAARSDDGGGRPRLSVGLAVFNGENYLEESIESILAQTYTDFELIISDNASTDRTPDICKRYLDDPRVRYHRNATNIGGANNENLTFTLARGEFFRNAAHDDICHSRLFEACVDALDRDPDAILCYTKIIEIDGDGEITGERLLGRATDPRPSVRFREMISRAHNCELTYGVVRSAVLRQTSLQRNYTDSDRVMLGELAIMGRFIELDEGLFYKRYHTKNVYVDWRERMSWFDPDRRKGSLTFPHWVQVCYTWHVALTTPVRLSTRLRCTGWALVWTIGRSGNLARELYEAVRRIARMRPRDEAWRYNWE